MKKDRVFVIVIALVLSNLAVWTASIISNLVSNTGNTTYWAYLIADSLAIFGALWLFRSYRRGRKRIRELERMHEGKAEVGDDNDGEE